MSSDCYFEIEEAYPTGLVTGRNSYVDIPLGAVFTSLRKARFDGPLVDLRKVDLGVVAGVSLRLDKVEVFRKSIDVIPRGYSAGLYLSGDGIDLVQQALLGRRERESLTLHLD